MATKNSPWTTRLGSPSIQFIIIFQKYFQLFSSLTMLGKFTIFHFVFIIMYIIVHYIDLGYEQSYMKSVKIKVFFHTRLPMEKISENL